MDLFSRLNPPCGDCVQLDPKPTDSGLRYCHGEKTWRWPTDRVEACPYRDRPPLKPAVSGATWAEACRDLLESPRHDISAKGRTWLKAELRRALDAERAAA